MNEMNDTDGVALEEELDQWEPGNSVSYGTFFVGTSEFALPTARVREVVPFPDALTAIPRADDSALGIFSLRGEVLPVVDLAQVLGLERSVERSASRVAVIEDDDHCIGIAIDRTGEVIRASSTEVQSLEHHDEAGTQVIDGVIRLEQGERFIQTLSPSVLGIRPGVPRAQSGRHGRASLDERTYSKLIVVRSGSTELGFPIEGVLEIQADLEISESPTYFHHCAGVTALRGDTFALLDLRPSLGGEPGLVGSRTAPRTVFVEHDGGRVGIIVDQLVETLEYSDDQRMRIPKVPTGALTKLCDSLVEPEEGRHVMIVSVPQVFEAFEIPDLTKLLGGPSDESPELDYDVDQERGFFTFRVGEHILSLALEAVREVREVHDEAFTEEGADGDLYGLINLRGRVLPMISAHRRLGIAHVEGEQRPIGLVVEGQDSESCLVVDGVVDIKRVPSSSLTAYAAGPSAGNALRGLMDHVQGTLLSKRADGEGDVLVVLDPDKLQ